MALETWQNLDAERDTIMLHLIQFAQVDMINDVVTNNFSLFNPIIINFIIMTTNVM